jgi:hypothetical protein
MIKTALILLSGLFLVAQASAAIPVKGGCVVGKSQEIHGLSAADAEARIRGYARLYVENYMGFKGAERDSRSKSYSYMELKYWKQEDILGFTREQRELLYISVGGELGAGKISAADLPGYVEAINRKIIDIELELGCEVPATVG